jgi:hypothetical protein
MCAAKDRPLLAEGEFPDFIIPSAEPIDIIEACQNVLHFAWSLVVRFLDQKRIVLNAIDVPLGGWNDATTQDCRATSDENNPLNPCCCHV